MTNLNQNKSYIFLTVFLFFGCVTNSKNSFYKIINQNSNQTEINLSSDRILLECGQVSDERPEAYYFLIYFLNDENTVSHAMQGNQLDLKSCQNRISYISNLLKKGNQIYLAGMGTMRKTKIVEKRTFTFKNHGTFPENSRGLQFMYISNENGQCYGAYTETTKPCPRDEFPIK